MFAPNLMKIPSRRLEISGSQEWDGRQKNPQTPCISSDIACWPLNHYVILTICKTCDEYQLHVFPFNSRWFIYVLTTNWTFSVLILLSSLVKSTEGAVRNAPSVSDFTAARIITRSYFARAYKEKIREQSVYKYFLNNWSDKT